tara:strand:- start:74 stop:1288 length:1215 start_codon:yes stop_codon:yes gene_type:complete
LIKSKHFHVIGVSYKTADIELRSRFSLNETQLHGLFLEAKDAKLRDFLVINTCNRTEIYAWTSTAETLIELLCKHTGTSRNLFDIIGYTHSDSDGFHHLFRVGTGLESQILGDFEIIGQIKKSFYHSKKMTLAHGLLERITNAVIQASKRIKTETEISSGATSVAFASVQYILKNVIDISKKNIVLFGTGKIGANTCENLVKHTQNDHIVLINRTQEKAEKIAGKFPVIVKPFGSLTTAIHDADVLIVATGAQNPTVNLDLIHNNKPLLILDLSIPRNVSPEVNNHPLVKVIHLDELSQITDATFEKRQKHIPKAEKILKEVEDEFFIWLEHRKYVPTLKAFKEKIVLSDNMDNEITSLVDTDQIIQKITGQIAAYLRTNPEKAEETVAVLKNVFDLAPENFNE